MSGQGFYAPGNVDLDLWSTDPKINRDEINLELMSWQYFVYDEQMDGHTDDMRHNIIWPKVPVKKSL